jgi:hypothetical protein
VIVDLNTIRSKVREIAGATLKAERVDDVLVESDVDQRDRDALRITVVLRDRRNLKVEGEEAVSIIVATSEFLEKSGDERFPYVSFVTTKELASLNLGHD